MAITFVKRQSSQADVAARVGVNIHRLQVDENQHWFRRCCRLGIRILRDHFVTSVPKKVVVNLAGQ
jgi:hypothetical protein